jgi:hypothetical protein
MRYIDVHLGFNDGMFGDDLKQDKYKLYFADDANSDGSI